MSNNVKTLLKSLGVTDETIIEALIGDADSQPSREAALKAAQTYARPFIETELNAKFNDERKTYKGKYFKDMLGKANKVFGSPLTNKEIEDIINDPENEGRNYDVALDALKEKVTAKTGAKDSELQKMLDIANGKISDFEAKIPEIESTWQKKYEADISAFKLDGVVSKRLAEYLSGKTAMDAGKAADLLRDKLGKKAFMKLKEDGSLGLFDLKNNDVPLKRNETTLETFEGLVDGLVSEYGIGAKSKGTHSQQTGQTQHQVSDGTGQKINSGLGARMADVTAAN